MRSTPRRSNSPILAKVATVSDSSTLSTRLENDETVLSMIRVEFDIRAVRETANRVGVDRPAVPFQQSRTSSFQVVYSALILT
jgi:hypothetical protein